jgi:hypothetical protein
MYKKIRKKKGRERERERKREIAIVPSATPHYHQKESKAHLLYQSRREKKKTKPSKIVFRRTPTKQQENHMDNHIWILKSSIISDHPTPPPSQPLTFSSLQPHQSIKAANNRVIEKEKKVVPTSLSPP